METVFDHNITVEEMLAVFGYDDITIDDFKEWNQEDHYSVILRLYGYRKNKEMYQKYYDLIPDNIHKLFGTCYHDYITEQGK